MRTHQLHIREVRRWLQINENEGELDGRPVTCYALVAPSSEWENTFHAGTDLRVEAWLERLGEITIVPPGVPTVLTHLGGVVYEVVANVVSVDGDQLEVDTTPPLRVDLQVTPYVQVTEVRTGDAVRVRGELKVDLPFEDD